MLRQKYAIKMKKYKTFDWRTLTSLNTNNIEHFDHFMNNEGDLSQGRVPVYQWDVGDRPHIDFFLNKCCFSFVEWTTRMFHSNVWNLCEVFNNISKRYKIFCLQRKSVECFKINYLSQRASGIIPSPCNRFDGLQCSSIITQRKNHFSWPKINTTWNIVYTFDRITRE